MSPRESFQLDPQAVQRHNDLLERSDVRDNLLVAFNEFCWSMPPSDTPEQAAHNNGMREGARGLINTFLNLGSKPRGKQQNTAANLIPQDDYRTRRYARRTQAGAATSTVSPSPGQAA